MSRNTTRNRILTLALCVLALAACGKPKEEASVLTDTSGLLRYVPADTPYVFAALEPAPGDVMDKLQPGIDRMLDAYRSMLAVYVRQLEEAAADTDGVDAPEFAGMEIGAAFSELFSMEGLEQAGITRDSTSVVYGNGLLPVIRLTLSDGKLMDAAIDEIEAAADVELAVGEIDGKPYRYFDSGEARIIVALLDGQLVLSVAPLSFDAAQMRGLLGLELPDTNIAETGLLLDIAREYGFMEAYTGFISTERLAATFLDEPSGLDTVLLKLVEYDSGILSDVCKAEIRSMAKVAPRMVFGYEAMTVDSIDSTFVVELREDIAAGLESIPAPVPGLGAAHGGLFSFGMSMDLKAARRFYEERLAALEEAPYDCEHFADLQGGAAQARAALNRPLPPIVYDFHGFLAVIEDLQGIRFGGTRPPESVEASLLIAMDDAEGLLSFGQIFSPELAALELEPGGEAKQLPLPVAQAGIDSAWLALSDDGLAISVGDDGKTAVSSMLAAGTVSPAPFMSMGLDAGRYYELIGKAMLADSDEDNDTELQAAVAEMLTAAGSLYDRVSVDVELTERGIEMKSEIALAD